MIPIIDVVTPIIINTVNQNKKNFKLYFQLNITQKIDELITN